MNSTCWHTAHRVNQEALAMALCFVIAKLEASTERVSPTVMLDWIETKLVEYERLQAEVKRRKDVFP